MLAMAIQLTPTQAQELYTEITDRVYDMVGEELNTLEQKPFHGDHNMVDKMQPLLEQAGATADVVGSHFLEYCERGNLPLEKRMQIETMLRAAFSEVFSYHEKIDATIPPEDVPPGNPDAITTIDRAKPGVLLDLLPEMPYLDEGPGQKMFRQGRVERGDEFADDYLRFAADLAIHLMHVTRALNRVDEKNLVKDVGAVEIGAKQTTMGVQRNIRKLSKDIQKQVMRDNGQGIS
jgi:hypothetical protein